MTDNELISKAEAIIKENGLQREDFISVHTVTLGVTLPKPNVIIHAVTRADYNVPKDTANRVKLQFQSETGHEILI